MTELPFNDELDADVVPLDPRITLELFLEWRAPRLGSANPERMNNVVWEWLIHSRVSAYEATERLGGPTAIEDGPGWCFDRFGQSVTKLPDDRIVLIGGEHEDHYDPDFHIYNDVVVVQPDGRSEIFGYPTAVFPPTDFHSATLVGDRIIVVGTLGYPNDRRSGVTPVYVLDLKTFAIAPMPTSGTSPGWIHRHKASLDLDGASLLLRRGVVDRGVSDEPLVDNIDDWRLRLADGQWERLTNRQWQRWEVRRVDGQAHQLFKIQMAAWSQQLPELAAMEEALEPEAPSGTEPDLDVFARLYRPELPHEEITESEEDGGSHLIRVDGVVVRYTDNRRSIQILVEGDLLQSTVDSIVADLQRKLSLLENAECEARPL